MKHLDKENREMKTFILSALLISSMISFIESQVNIFDATGNAVAN